MQLPGYNELSKEQLRILNLPLEDRVLVTGAPGTGKTLMALFRAQRLVQEEVETVVLTYNRSLQTYVDKAVSSLGIKGSATTFHSFLYSWWWKHFRESPPSDGGRELDWTAIQVKLATEMPDVPKPVILLDEGQDLPRPAHTALRLISGDRINTFADENQRITASNSTVDEIRKALRPDHDETLTTNYRNTEEIASCAAWFHRDAETGVAQHIANGDPGDVPMLTAYRDQTAELTAIETFAKTFDDETTGVLVPTIRQRKQIFSSLKDRLPKGRVQQFVGGQGKKTVPLQWDRPGVKVLCWSSAKGLQFDNVWLPQLERVPDRDLESTELFSTLYVMCTRPRLQLRLSYSGPSQGCRILKHLPPDDLLERDG